MPLSLETMERSSSFNQYDSICDQDFPEDDSDTDSCVSSSSSLGRNSDSSEDDSSDREEVEKNSFKGPLDTMKDLEKDLPVK
ncbi:hypothetical protein MtrunA17_Chr0c27g0493901 [Medicago truncatula]|uniref:Uncharacterized protein n=2 Tax=Medicago truncatula TaxID=3880 RepID=A0A396GI09_MEDTR|nr:hypothetical protein MtrunA17_Chr0c27g0493901 [Medicago truncatula]